MFLLLASSRSRVQMTIIRYKGMNKSIPDKTLCKSEEKDIILEGGWIHPGEGLEKSFMEETAFKAGLK